MLNVVLLVILTTAILGPVFTGRFAPQALLEVSPAEPIKVASRGLVVGGQ
jgi:hypothetical protein